MLFHRRFDILQYVVAFKPAVVTPHTFATIFIPAMFTYYLMAVLVQLPPAGFYRAALLPVVFWTTLRASMSLDFSGNDVAYAHLNQALTLGMFLITLRSTVWVFASRPYTRLPISKSGNSSIDGRNGDTPTPTEHGTTIFSAMWNALDLTVNLRGIGWDGLPMKHIPTPNFQVESRSTFVLLTLGRLAILGLVFDILSTCIHLLGPDTFGTPKGGTIFDPSLTPPERYMKSSIVTLLSGFASYVTINGTYQVYAVWFTILFHQYPSQWPPLFDSPWLSTSLTSFWGQRWHQLFRECFVAVRSKPLERYLGRVGSIIAAFALSGILHDIGIRGMGRGSDTLSVAGFFVMHGVGVAMEHAWKRATGRRVGGIIGWLWTFSWHILWGHVIVDAWARRGLIGVAFFPDAYSPTTLFLNWMSRKNVAS
ncbi:membrane bound O-acyl transferase family-domain-containing protein [Boletus coccyginus]|nr:membrane bound O-acyl transferase family-domain-containing protein [Boletus coccyginus]